MPGSRENRSVVSSIFALLAPVVVVAAFCGATSVAHAQVPGPSAPATGSPAARHAQAASRILTAVRGENDGVESLVLVGTAGQIYTLSPRSDKSAGAQRYWQRRQAGGVAVALRGAMRGPGGTIVATGERTPLFVWHRGRWSGFVLPNRGDTVIAGPGSHAAVAVGRHLYLHATRGASGSKGFKSSWRRVTRSRRAVTALWADNSGVIYLGDSTGALRRYRRGQWRAIGLTGFAPDERIIAIAGLAAGSASGTSPKRELIALSSAGKLVAITGTRARLVPTPDGFKGFVAQAIGAAPDGSIVAAGMLAPAATPSATTGAVAVGKPALGRIRSGKMTAQVAQAAQADDAVAAVRADSNGDVLVAMSSGRIWVLSKGSWRMDLVSDKLPPSATRRFTNRGPALAN